MLREFPKMLATALRNFFLSKVGFWCNGLYDFVPSESSFSLSRSKVALSSKWIILLGREHYFETVKDFPIGHRRDLKSVLKNESGKFPFMGIVFSRLRRLTDQSHRVTFWVVDPETFEKLATFPLWILPESACLEFFSAESIVKHDRLGKSVFVSLNAAGLISSAGGEETLLLQFGVASKDDRKRGEEGDYSAVQVGLDRLLEGAARLIRTDPLTFFKKTDPARLVSFPWKQSLKLSGSFIVLYFLVTSLYLQFSVGVVDLRLSQQKEKSEVSVAMRQEIQRYRVQVEELHDLFSGLSPLWNTWDIYMDLDSKVDSFRAVNSSSGAVIFFLRAERALDVLTWLTQDNRVESAQFETPVRKVGQLEEFAVKVYLRNAPLSLEQANFSGRRLNTPPYKQKLSLVSRLNQGMQLFPLQSLEREFGYD